MIRTQKFENKIVTSCETAHKPILPTARFNSKIRINFIDTVLVIDSKRLILEAKDVLANTNRTQAAERAEK